MQLAIQPLFKTNSILITGLWKKQLKGEILQLKEFYQIAFGYNPLTIPTHCSFTFSNLSHQSCNQLTSQVSFF